MLLLLGDWISLIGFWIMIIRLARLDGYRLPAIFSVVWFAAYFGSSFFGIAGPLYFLIAKSLLLLILIFVDTYRENAKKRTPKVNPLEL